MSTLFFTAMNNVYGDADWSHLLGGDTEDDYLTLEDDFSEESNAEVDFEWDDLLY